ncbi:flagellar basal body rod protein FlgB [Carnobacterium inhibens]|uniref:Flagellar basal body rod protein FlgB n=1 Tax=Carnobacterium inhibens TaxID=147709 RepID=A0ABR7T8W9_9LACT|nr:flagellar basal body rod protein FlgB [Carnobacterium inhibens]MBC9824493.1 flagellar basal body rod protein FlgB [Carnobacterium inhibens]
MSIWEWKKVDSTYNLMKNALDAASMRQEMISSNVANVNTADYKVNKVDFETILDNVSNGTAMNKTNDLHIGFGNLEDVSPVVSKRTDTTVKENGNNVDIDIEMAEEASNSIYYNAMITQLNAKYSMLRSVITK